VQVPAGKDLTAYGQLNSHQSGETIQQWIREIIQPAISQQTATAPIPQLLPPRVEDEGEQLSMFVGEQLSQRTKPRYYALGY
jgi:hypothetical protein